MTPDAFEELVRPYRRELAAHCYRMLGSLHDAEDQVQETLLSAWRGIDGFEGRASVRVWLYKIATNRCLDEIRRRPRQGLPSQHGEPTADPREPLPARGELLWVEPSPAGMWADTASAEALYSQRESVQLAFIVALQLLPATQRAALILRDVLGWSAAEVAALLDTTVVAINSALQRARATLDARRCAEIEPAVADAIAARYISAWEEGDLEALVGLLHEDVTITMPPLPSWFRGRAAVRAFFTERMNTQITRRVIRVDAADTLVFAFYRGKEPSVTGYAIHVLHVDDGLVSGAHAFLEPVLFPRFGVPVQLEPGERREGRELDSTESRSPRAEEGTRRMSH
jgi:RNA polymerase sigma-70 factor (ECF subfamily)